MTLFLNEIKRNKIPLAIWTAAISFMLGICVLIYPEMAKEMDQLTDMFANMGAFSDAFGMDKLNFGEFTGYFAIECGNVLGLGGAIFAAILGVSALAGEERDGTAEFLLTHPVSRAKITLFKLLSVMAQVLVLNACVALVTVICCIAVGVEIKAVVLALMLIAYLVMQIEIAAITFGISAFVNRGALGIGIGVSMGLYCLNIVANLDDRLDFAKFITPFSYTDGGYITEKVALDFKYLIIGIVISAVGIALAFWRYDRKDIK